MPKGKRKPTAKDRYPDLFDQARDVLVLAQAKLLDKTHVVTRSQIDRLYQHCRAMHLSRPRSFASLINTCMILSEISPGDSVTPLLRQFQDIIDDVRERERRRPRLVPAPEPEDES